MNKNIILCVLFLLAVGLFVNCSGPSDYMVLDEIRYVDAFPQTFLLDNGVEVDLESLDIIGVKDFCIYDSLLVLSTTDKEGFWSFVSLSDYRFLGKFLTQGQGPYEFYSNPFVSSSEVKLFNENEENVAIIYHFDKGRLYKMNINESIKNNKLNIYTINDSIRPFIFDFVMIDSITFFCKEISNRETQQIRYILVNDIKITPPHLEKLNLAKIREREDFNILSTITKYEFNSKRFVEMPGHLNYINIYSLDGSFAKTICIGKRLDHIGKIQDKNKWTERKDTFSDLRLFPRFWGVAFIDEYSYTRERTRFPNIMLFDWNGEPLAQLNLNNHITAFDIDFINGYLYTLDHKTDVFCKYDIREILEKL